MTEPTSDGWVKPTRAPTLDELKTRIAALRSELQTLEATAAEMIADERLQAIVQARNIMRAHQLSAADILAD